MDGYGGEHFDVDAFCLESGLDEKATTELKNLDEASQREVLGRGSLTNTRNPSAVLLSRIRQLNQGGGGGGGGGGRKGGYSAKNRDDLEEEVTRFAKENDLDERATACLRESDADILTELFARGPLTDARNPSAMALSRIRSIKDDIASGKIQRGGSRGKGGSKGYDGGDKGKGKGKGKDDDWWWYMPPWAWWGGKGGEWDSWGKGDWGKGGKGGKGGKDEWDEGKGKGKGGKGKGRPGPY